MSLLYPVLRRCRAKALLCTFPLFSTLFLFSLQAGAREVYTTDGVNVRSRPDSDSEVYFAVSSGTAVTPISTSGNWIQISVDGVVGYIYKDYISDTPGHDDESAPSSYVNSTEVNLRKKANSHCKIKAVLDEGETVQILSCSGNWTKIQRADGMCGFVYSMYLGEKKDAPKKPSREEVISQYRASAISYAQTRLGNAYSQEFRDNDGYADCSSLVRDAFLSATGNSIGNTTVSQAETMMNYFYGIGKITDAAPGDLLYHLSGDNHTGIYLGNGEVLHASQKSGFVIVSSYESDSTYWEYGCNAAAYCYDN